MEGDGRKERPTRGKGIIYKLILREKEREGEGEGERRRGRKKERERSKSTEE